MAVVTVLLAAAVPLSAAEHWVDPALGSDAWPGSEAQPWRTLSHALATAAAGDTVRARAGIYGSEETFPLTLVDGVALVGEGVGSSVIVAPLDRDHFVMDGSPLGPSTRLEGFTLRGDYPGRRTVMIFHLGAAVVEPVITRNRFDAYGWNAISIREQSENGGVFAARITDNDICGFSEVFADLRMGGPHTFAPVLEDNFFSCGDAGSFVVDVSRSWHGTLAPVLRRNRFAGNFHVSVVKVQTDQQVTVAPILDSNSGFFGFDLCPPEAGSPGSVAVDIGLLGESLDGQRLRVGCTVPDDPASAPEPRSLASAAGPSAFSLRAEQARLGSVDIDLASTVDRWDGGISIQIIDSQTAGITLDLGGALIPVRRDVLIAGNRITPFESWAAGVRATIDGAGEGSLRAEGNRIEAMQWGSPGIDLRVGDWRGEGAALECNRIESWHSPAVEVSRGTGLVDLGGAGLSSGLNSLLGTSMALVAPGDDPLSARHTWWGTVEPTEIEARIAGAVEYMPFLQSPPGSDLGATLVAGVVEDVAPMGASIGDTLEYTVTIFVPDGACGDRDVLFALALPDNVVLVPGSVTSDRGAVLSEQPIEADIGWLGVSDTATMRWRVVVDSGTRVVSQGRVCSQELAERLTDDPGEPGTADPTVVELVVAPAIPVGGGALAALAAGIAAAGGLLLRRRRQLREKSIT